MINLIRDSAIRIPIDKYGKEFWTQNIINDLTRVSIQYGTKEKTIKEYFGVDQSTNCFMIPRYYPLPSSIELQDNLYSGTPISYQTNIVPRTERQKISIEWMSRRACGVLCLDPGEGKTVVTIEALKNIGKKSIIFVHKDSLAQQWLERFLQHSSLKDEDIARLRTDNYIDDLKKPIIISTVQTFCSILKRKDCFHDLLTSGIGVAVWDECHTSVSAEQFSKSSLHLPCKRTFGLSATPTRADGNDDIIGYHLGDVFIPGVDRSKDLKPKILVVKFDFEIVNHKSSVWLEHRTKWDIDNHVDSYFDNSRYLKKIESCSVYYSKMKGVIKEFDLSKRHTLILSDRISILDKLSTFVSNREEVGFFLPRSGKERDSELINKRIVLSTYGSARDGTDKPILDSLIFATPPSNLKQAIGRILRPFEDKKPVVVDLVDVGCKRMIEKYNKRKEFYEEHQWVVKEREI